MFQYFYKRAEFQLRFYPLKKSVIAFLDTLTLLELKDTLNIWTP